MRSHVDALKRKMPDPEAAILGCTHYPLVAEAFQAALGDGVKVYSQGDLVADSWRAVRAGCGELINLFEGDC